jgi:NADH dehydrogenase [ubiquinone] 1 alpha subcomplex assembly factor 7
MTALGDILARRIASTGPMTIADYMSECLLHPDHGYYSTGDPFGSAGDFTTSPEISQMFGELIGLSLAQCWIDQGRPDAFTLGELGPGRGTLMADILRATKVVPGFSDAARVHMVEASQTLRDHQKRTLGGLDVMWHDDISTLPDLPLYLVANEFFDALPTRQFMRDAGGWRERHVGLIAGKLRLGLSAPAPISALTDRLADTAAGDIVEISAAARNVMNGLSQRISQFGGAAIVIDYGDWQSLGDTFQAVHNHRVADPMASPGDADLSAHVDFCALAQSAPEVLATDMVPQGVLLERLGITARAQALAHKLTGPELGAHISAQRRLTHPDEMGTLFKAIAFHPVGTPPPPGFAR